MFSVINETFTNWLNAELEKREWNYSKLATKAKISKGTISHILSGRRNPGSDFCEKIARAFNIPPDEVYRRAGLLPPAPVRTSQTEELIYLFNQFPDNEKADLITYMRIKLAMFEKAGKIKT